MLEVILAKLSTLGVAAKAGVAAGALALSGSAAAVTGTLPAPAQERVAATVERIAGLEIPGGSRADGDHRPADADIDASDVDVPEAAEVERPAQADFGANVSDMARSGAPQEDGRAFGEAVSSSARETFAPSDRPTAGDNPGAEHAENRPASAPGTPPAPQDNPGADSSGDGGAPSSRPTPSDNPGTSASGDAGAPDSLPTPDPTPGRP